MKIETQSSAVLAAWQICLEEHLEQGVPPLVALGARELTPENLPALQAVTQMTTNPAGLERLNLAVGGDGVLWLAALHQQNPVHLSASTGMTALHYTGPDVATHLAGLNLLADPAVALDPAQPPAGFHWLLNPTHHPGAVGPWDWLFMAEEDAISNPGHPDGILAYLGLLLVVALLIATLLL